MDALYEALGGNATPLECRALLRLTDGDADAAMSVFLDARSSGPPAGKGKRAFRCPVAAAVEQLRLSDKAVVAGTLLAVTASASGSGGDAAADAEVEAVQVPQPSGTPTLAASPRAAAGGAPAPAPPMVATTSQQPAPRSASPASPGPPPR